MKKLKFAFLAIILCAICLIPTTTANAISKDIYYPYGIEDYVDLSTLVCFDIHDNDIFYATNEQKVYGYNKLNKKTTEIASNVGNAYSVKVAGEYIFVMTSNTTKIFNLDYSEISDISAYKPPTYSNAIVRFFNNQYYYLYTQSNGVSQTLKLDICNNSLTKIASYSFNLTSGSFVLDMTSEYIFAKNTTGNTIYMFKQISDSTTTLTPIKDSSDNNYFTIVGITSTESVKSIAVLNDHILISANRINDAKFSENGITGCIYSDIKNGTKTISDNADLILTENDKLYIFNNANANINEFSFDANSNPSILSLNKSIIASKGNENGRFKNVSSVVFKAGTLYVSDRGNNRIQVVNKNEIFSYNTTNLKATEVITDKTNQMYYVLTNGTNSYLYKNAETTPLATITNDVIVSIDINLDGTIYMLSKTKIYTYNGTLSEKNVTLENSITDNSKIRIGVDYTNINYTVSSLTLNAKIYISASNKIYQVTTTSTITYYSQIASYEMPATIKDFNTNYFNNIIALLNNGALTKYTINAETSETSTLDGFNDYTCFDVDIVSGNIYIYNNTISAFEVVSDQEFSPKSTFGSYYPNIDAITNTQIWKYGLLKQNTLIYDYPYYVGNTNKIKVTDKYCVIISTPAKEVDGEIVYNGEFAYIGYVENNKLKTGYIELSNLDGGIKTIGQDGSTFKVRTTNKNVNVYKFPTICNVTTDSLDKEVVISKINQGTVVTTLGKYPISIDGASYYLVNYDGKYGYIYEKDVVSNDGISKTIKTNAKINIFDNSQNVFVYVSGEDGANVLLTLPNDYKINAINYNKKNAYTKVNFIDSDGQEREGYVLTKYIKPNGLTPAMITAIVLIIVDAVIAVAVIVFFNIYRKKQKAEAEKDNTDTPIE